VPGVELVQMAVRQLRPQTQHLTGGSWIRVSRDGRVILVYGLRSITVHVDGKVARTFPANMPYRLAISPDGNKLLVLPEQPGWRAHHAGAAGRLMLRDQSGVTRLAYK
jgi:hypothetical protein